MWEYKTVESHTITLPVDTLNQLGVEKWELINVLYMAGAGLTYYFKRPKIA